MAQQLVPDTLLQPVVRYFNPRQVILFGSRARGTETDESDYDLLVIVDDDTPREKLTLKAGVQSRLSYKKAADVIPCRESRFRDHSTVVGTLSYVAHNEGKVVYERPQ